MVKAQEWLDRKYLKEIRSEVHRIYLNELELEGELDLRDFTYEYGVAIYLSPELDATKLIFKNRPRWARIINCVQAQIWLDQNYPSAEKYVKRNERYEGKIINFGKTRSEITKLDISCQNLSGSLDLTEFNNLKELRCYDNQLTSLDVKDCEQLEELYCSNNQLTDLILPTKSNLKMLDYSDNLLTNLDWNALNAEKLTYFYLRNNNFSEQNLGCFSRFNNLKELWLGTDSQIKIHQGIYNRWVGSLKYLKDMNNLKYLHISNTDLNGDIEHLPKSLVDLFTGGEWLNLWKKLGFVEEEIKSWSDVGLTIRDYEIANYFQNKKKLTPEKVQQENLLWKNIHPNFTLQLQKDWEEKGFSYEKTKTLINKVGIKSENSYLAFQLVNREGLSLEILAERYEKYGSCQTCNRPNIENDWCQFCNEQKQIFVQKFDKQINDNKEIDNFIQQSQLETTIQEDELELIPHEQFTNIKYLDAGGFDELELIPHEQFTNIKYLDAGGFDELELIPHEQFTNIKYLDAGGFGTVYKSYWKSKGKEVALKILNNSQKIEGKFLQEFIYHKLVSNLELVGVVKCYGISQDPVSKNHIIVMQYVKDGNLRQYLRKNHDELDFYKRLCRLIDIAQGLNSIHQQGLIHCDFHPGNILNGIDFQNGLVINCLITDLGLCKPINEENFQEKVYGVLPYVAPEVLQGKPYTQESDVYSFAMVAYEIFTGLLPYHEYIEHISNKILPLRICGGLRPEFNLDLPPSLEILIDQCWDNDPTLRPSANDLVKILEDWRKEIDNREIEGFYQQYQERKHFLNNPPSPFNFKLHPQAVYTSRLIDTTSIITELLTESQTSNLSYDSEFIKTLEPNLNLGQLTIQKKNTLNTQDSNFFLWLQTIKSKDLENFADLEWVQDKINCGELNLEQLKKEYQEYQSEQYQAQIQLPPK